MGNVAFILGWCSLAGVVWGVFKFVWFVAQKFALIENDLKTLKERKAVEPIAAKLDLVERDVEDLKALRDEHDGLQSEFDRSQIEIARLQERTKKGET